MPDGRLRLSLAGFLATAVTFGPARMGFGLFLPVFRREFELSTQAAGFIASAAFLGFLLALPLAGILTNRAGPRPPVVSGGLLAALGMAMVGSAPDVATLAAGIVVAAASAGFCWTPYNDAARRMVGDGGRSSSLSAISTGTTFGVAAAGLLALLTNIQGLSWRTAWWLFAGFGLAVVAVNLVVLRGLGPASGALKPTRPALRSLLILRAAPLFGAAFSAGMTSAVYLAFAADRISAAADGGGAMAPVVFLAYGTGGAVGLAAGGIERRIGLAPLLKAIFLAFAGSVGLVALAPGSLPAALGSAALEGASVMTASAVLSFWSLRLFPALPAFSFTAVLMVMGAGAVLGPALAGVVAERFGGGTMFLCWAAIPLATALVLRPQSRSS